jgi:FkbM family methyltransferase
MYPEIFNKFNFKEGHLEPDIIHTRCGSVQLRKYDAELNHEINFSDDQCYDFYCKKKIAINNDAIFEWLDICESIDCATNQYTFVELGAGYARWAVIAYYLASMCRSLSTKLIIVEAEPTHYAWILENLETNNISIEDHDLYNGAIDNVEKQVLFEVGNSSRCYGQSIVNDHIINMLWRKIKYWYQRNIKSGYYNSGLSSVRTYILSSILSDIDLVDLIHMDIQGKEYDVLSASIDILNDKVKRLHIGTHSSEIENNLRELMSVNGWHCLRDFNRNSLNDTPFGEIRFEDGIQTWVNQRI